MLKKIKKYFITGIIVIAPVFITIYVLLAIFRFSDNILGKYLNIYLQKKLGFYLPGAGFLIALCIVLFVGYIANHFVFKRMLVPLDKWFAGLPLINKIYPGLKQIMSFITAQRDYGFRSVVLIRYPSHELWAIGFVTNEDYSGMCGALNKDTISVLVPTTPSPWSGFVVFVPKQEVLFLDISVTDAFKIIISGGVIKPEMFPKCSEPK
ncbi:MAG: DUF502 domain-containing protein [Candidatus Omnitrophota bacterium]